MLGMRCLLQTEIQEIMNRVNMGIVQRTQIANRSVQNKLINKQNLTTSLLTIGRAVIRVVHLPTSNTITCLVSNMGDKC